MDFEYGCEECGTENEELLDTILDNKPLRLCERCARNSGALVLREEREKNREKWNERRNKKPEQTYREEPRVSLQGLWDRYKQKMGERNTLEKQQKMVVLEEKKFLEDLEKQKKLENKEIVQAVEADFNPDEKIEEQKEFDKEASKKINLKSFFKQTFKFLKGKEKSESDDERAIPEMVPEMVESLEERKNEN
jgi:hypothetical protein